MKNERFWRWGCAALGALAITLALRPTSVTAQNGSLQGTVATVNLEVVINGLSERADMQVQLESFIAGREAELQRLGQQVEDARAALDVAVPGTEDERQKVEQVTRLTLQAQLEKEYSEQLVANRRAMVFYDLFQKVQDAAERLADRRGYQVVVSSDMTAQLPAGTEAQVRSAIIARRVLYASPAIDISAELLQMMNNEYAAGSNP